MKHLVDITVTFGGDDEMGVDFHAYLETDENGSVECRQTVVDGWLGTVGTADQGLLACDLVDLHLKQICWWFNTGKYKEEDYASVYEKGTLREEEVVIRAHVDEEYEPEAK